MMTLWFKWIQSCRLVASCRGWGVTAGSGTQSLTHPHEVSQGHRVTIPSLRLARHTGLGKVVVWPR